MHWPINRARRMYRKSLSRSPVRLLHQRYLMMFALLCLPLMLGGCFGSADTSVLTRDLPFGPVGISTPVRVEPPRVGEVCVVYAARERAGRIANAARLNAYEKWYSDVRTSYAVKPE